MKGLSMQKVAIVISVVVCVGAGIYIFGVKGVGNGEKSTNGGVDSGHANNGLTPEAIAEYYVDNSPKYLCDMELTLEVRCADVIRIYVEEASAYNTDVDFTKRMDRILYDVSKIGDRSMAIDKFLSDCYEEDLYAIFNTDNRENIKADVEQRFESCFNGAYNSICNRVAVLGPKSSSVQIQGDDTIAISLPLPNVDEVERVKHLLLSTANVEFWAVGSGNIVNQVREIIAKSGVLTGMDFRMSESWYDYVVGSSDNESIKRILEAFKRPENRELLPFDVKLGMEKGDDGEFNLVVLSGREPLMNGTGITDARAGADAYDHFTVSITMDNKHTKMWANITANNVGKQIAIVMDDVVYSAPVVTDRITGGESVISGNFYMQEAEDLASILRLAHLPFSPAVVSLEVRER
jgi:protein-export membrane protein SecD